jgi:hypothetical protein
MAHSSSLLVVASAFALCSACSGEVNTVPADTSDAGKGGTTATGGSGGGSAGTGGTEAGGSGGTGGTAIDGGVGGSGGAPAPGQEILFEVSYENYAWGAQLNGIFITNDGSVFQYDYFASDGGTPPPAYQHATEPELRARWGTVTGPVAQVPVEVVEAQFAVVESVARGVLLTSDLCDDAGELTYLGYLYDSASATYSRVVAGIDGDMAAKNLASGAEGLVSWLAGIHGGGGFCTFMAAECTGAVCAQTPPACSSGFVPSVVNGCWGDCVPVTRCLEVADCSWCDGVCATSELGSRHCSSNFCSGPGPCECGYSPCGGGADFCAAESGVAVTCGAP